MRYLAVMPGGPPADAADPEEDGEGDREQQHGECRRSGRVAAVQMLEDIERGDLRLEREVAGNEDDGTELAHSAREGERDAGEQRGQKVRKDDAPKDREPVGAERRRRLFHL